MLIHVNLIACFCLSFLTHAWRQKLIWYIEIFSSTHVNVAKYIYFKIVECCLKNFDLFYLNVCVLRKLWRCQKFSLQRFSYRLPFQHTESKALRSSMGAENDMVIIIWSNVDCCYNGQLHSVVDRARFAISLTDVSINSNGLLISAHRRMRTVTNYFVCIASLSICDTFLIFLFIPQLLNLSISDLLMASLNCVFNFIFMIDSGK